MKDKDEDENKIEDKDDKEQKRMERKRARADRMSERKRLQELVPKVDENGISFTKLQIKRMTKRVKRGLAPIETQEEAQERNRREAEMRKEERRPVRNISNGRPYHALRPGCSRRSQTQGLYELISRSLG